MRQLRECATDCRVLPVVFLLVFGIASGSAINGQIPFDHVVVDASGPSDLWTKAVGDFDGDGFIDLVATGTNGVIYWYEYPDWNRHTITTSGGSWGTDTESGDVDGDGDADLVVSDWSGDNRIAWYENPSPSDDPRTGSWTLHVIGSPRAHDIEVGDLDGDGDLDIVTRDQGSAGDQIVFWQQNSPSSWSKRTQGTPGGEGLHLGDIDQDGDPDVLIGGRWYENPGNILTGSWQERVFASNWSHDATLPWLDDINGDGRPDVILTPSESAGQSYRTSWYEAPVDPINGNWTEHIIDQSVEAVTHGLGVGDMNNDGALDVVTAEMHQGSDPDEIRVYINDNGDGTAWTKQIVDTKGSHSIRVVDIGNDGDLDIFGANWTGTTIVDLWENRLDPDGTLPLDDWTFIQVDGSRSLSPGGGGFFGLDMGDVDNDGYSDIVSGKYFYRNPGGSMIGSWDRVTFPIAMDGMLIVDVDGDGFADAIAEALPAVYWLEATDAAGNGWNSRQIATLPTTSHGSGQGYALAQIVAGGRPEILLSTGNGIHYLEIPANPEAGSWPTTRINSPGTEEGIGTGDIDGDGDIDVSAGVQDGTGQVAWWENPGNGNADWPTHQIGSLPSAYADRFHVADLDGDGRKDIVVSAANGSNNGVYWFRQPADPQSPAWPRQLVFSLDSANSMDVADMDADGDQDIITGEHQGSLRVFVLENVNQAGSWVPHQVDSGRESHLGTRVADLDGDGDLEIVSIAWSDYQDLYVWRNDAQLTGTARVAKPVIQPNGGTFVGSVVVSLSTTTPGASIYYTINGGDPTQNSTLYGSPISLSSPTTIRARAFKSGLDASDVSTAAFTITQDTTAPSILSVTASGNPNVVGILFSEAVDESRAEDIGNYAISHGVSVSSAILQPDAITVLLSTSTLSESVSYSLTVNDVQDRAAPPNTIAPNTQVTFEYVSILAPNGLVGYWSFDAGGGSVAADATSNGNDGSIQGPVWTDGYLGGGLEFDGSNDSVDLGGLDVAGSGLSIVMWFKADGYNPADVRLCSKATGTSEQDHYWMLSTIAGPNLRFRLKTNGTTSTLAAASGALQVGVWTHVVATYDGSAMRIYKDGVMVGSLSKSGPVSTNSGVAAWIGRNPDGYGPWDGIIDEVRIYDRGLSEAEIEMLFAETPDQQAVPPAPPSLAIN